MDKNKAKAIQAAIPPRNKKQLQRLLGQINFLRRFISNCAGKTNIFSPLLKLKTEDPFEWNEQHQKAFDLLKQYLLSPLVLKPPRKDKDLKLYISTSEESIGSMLVQDNELGKEQVVYYLSRVLTSIEQRYSSIKKLYLSLYFAS